MKEIRWYSINDHKFEPIVISVSSPVDKPWMNFTYCEDWESTQYCTVLLFCIKEWDCLRFFNVVSSCPDSCRSAQLGRQSTKQGNGIIYEAVIHQHLFISSSMFRFPLFSLHDIVNMETTKKVNVIIEKQEVQSLLISMKWYCCPTQKEIFKLGYPIFKVQSTVEPTFFPGHELHQGSFDFNLASLLFRGEWSFYSVVILHDCLQWKTSERYRYTSCPKNHLRASCLR